MARTDLGVLRSVAGSAIRTGASLASSPGTLRLSYMQDAYSRMQLGKDALLTLYDTDGTLLAREPRADARLGTVVLNAETIARIKGGKSGPNDTFEATSPIDGITRVFGYRPVGPLPLVQFAAVSNEEVYAPFWRRAAEIGTLLAALSTGIALLLVVAKREIDHRMAAECEDFRNSPRPTTLPG